MAFYKKSFQKTLDAENQGLLTIHRAFQKTGIKKVLLYQWIKTNELKSYNFQNIKVINEAELVKFLNKK